MNRTLFVGVWCLCGWLAAGAIGCGASAKKETDSGMSSEDNGDSGIEDAGPMIDATGIPKPTFLGSTAAFITNGRQLNLFNDTVPAGSSVSGITQTFPIGSVDTVHAVYTTSDDPKFAAATDLGFKLDKVVGNNQQWYVILPAQSAGTTIVWYVYALGFDGTKLYDSGNGQNFHYTSQ